MPAHPRILLTGATGYVGGRLLKALETDGHYSIRCLARRPENLAGKVADTTEVVPGDLLDVDSLNRAMAGVDVAYYLVHSLGSSGDLRLRNRPARGTLPTPPAPPGFRASSTWAVSAAAKLPNHRLISAAAGASATSYAIPAQRSSSSAHPSSSVPAACPSRWCAPWWNACR